MARLENRRKLSRLAVFERPARTSDGGGGFAINWETAFSRRVLFLPETPKPGAEKVQFGGVSSVAAASLVVAESAAALTIAADWRVTINGETWNIRRVQHDQPNRTVDLAIETGVAQ